MLLKSLANRYWRLRGYPLAGALAGCYMRGDVPESYREGSYEPEVCKAIMRIVKPGWVCVDVGAHTGYFTLLLAKLAGEQGRVIAFEAHPVNARSVDSNVKINGYETRAQVENIAVTDGSSNWVKLFPGRRHASAEWNILGHDLEGNLAQPELAVPATSLDAYFPPRSHVDFIKMDIERAEAQALRGMRRLLQECRAFVLVEFHDENGWAARQELFAAQCRLYDLTEGRWLDSEIDVQRVYHCLAVPKERLAGINL
jgi:FkbM family methyltransferase